MRRQYNCLASITVCLVEGVGSTQSQSNFSAEETRVRKDAMDEFKQPRMDLQRLGKEFVEAEVWNGESRVQFVTVRIACRS